MNNPKQLTLGDTIDKLNKHNLFDTNNNPKLVFFDFDMAIPTELDSWRGSYDELALGYGGSDDDSDKCYAKDLLEMFINAVGSYYTGYKGGDFIMGKDTPLWVDNYGECTGIGVVDIIDNSEHIIIVTKYIDY